ncbi:MAG: hypothetical protein Q9227_007455 [Pyrenula ochraceoflavens]
MISLLLRYALILAAIMLMLYAIFLSLLTTPSFQTHIVYLHKLQLPWFKDLDVPEIFGFLPNQVSPFRIQSSPTGDCDSVYAWHVLPLEVYYKNEAALMAEPAAGFVEDITSRHSFKLLRDDPDSVLVVHMHGAAGTVASGYRVPNYRALSAGEPARVHVLAFDYRGFGRSDGVPEEQGMILDAIAVVEWALEVAEIEAFRILIFGQSLGTAVAIAVSEHFAQRQSPPVVFGGTILVAPFVDVGSLVATYRVAGIIPILGPLARFPRLFYYLCAFIRDEWSSKERLARYLQANEANEADGGRYRITLIHAEDDWDVPWSHTRALFEHAVNCTVSTVGLDGVEIGPRNDLGSSGTTREMRTQNGVVREEILRYGLHDVIMGSPAVSMAVMRSLENVGKVS